MRKKTFFFFFIFMALVQNILANVTELPKFMSIKVNEANLRAGPGTNFPIELIYIKKNLVIEVIDDFENWYKIIDEEGNQGWLHKSLTGSKRYFVVSNHASKLYQSPKNKKPMLTLAIGLRGKIKSCRNKWCNIKFTEYSGWIKKTDIWGVYQDENFN